MSRSWTAGPAGRGRLLRVVFAGLGLVALPVAGCDGGDSLPATGAPGGAGGAMPGPNPPPPEPPPPGAVPTPHACGLSVTELAWQLGVDKSNASRVAETLADLGLCRFESATENARIKRVVPRAGGFAKALRIHAEVRAEHHHALAGSPVADLLACERVLAAIAQARMAVRGERTATARSGKQSERRRA